jgi:stress response protein SCP2
MTKPSLPTNYCKFDEIVQCSYCAVNFSFVYEQSSNNCSVCGKCLPSPCMSFTCSPSQVCQAVWSPVCNFTTGQCTNSWQAVCNEQPKKACNATEITGCLSNGTLTSFDMQSFDLFCSAKNASISCLQSISCSQSDEFYPQLMAALQSAIGDTYLCNPSFRQVLNQSLECGMAALGNTSCHSYSVNDYCLFYNQRFTCTYNNIKKACNADIAYILTSYELSLTKASLPPNYCTFDDIVQCSSCAVNCSFGYEQSSNNCSVCGKCLPSPCMTSRCSPNQVCQAVWIPVCNFTTGQCTNSWQAVCNEVPTTTGLPITSSILQSTHIPTTIPLPQTTYLPSTSSLPQTTSLLNVQRTTAAYQTATTLPSNKETSTVQSAVTMVQTTTFTAASAPCTMASLDACNSLQPQFPILSYDSVSYSNFCSLASRYSACVRNVACLPSDRDVYVNNYLTAIGNADAFNYLCTGDAQSVIANNLACMNIAEQQSQSSCFSSSDTSSVSNAVICSFYRTVLQCMFNVISTQCNGDAARVVVTRRFKSLQPSFAIYNCSFGVGSESTCPNFTCALACPFGYIKTSNGCNNCSCFDPCQNRAQCPAGSLCKAYSFCQSPGVCLYNTSCEAQATTCTTDALTRCFANLQQDNSVLWTISDINSFCSQTSSFGSCIRSVQCRPQDTNYYLQQAAILQANEYNTICSSSSIQQDYVQNRLCAVSTYYENTNNCIKPLTFITNDEYCQYFYDLFNCLYQVIQQQCNVNTARLFVANRVSTSQALLFSSRCVFANSIPTTAAPTTITTATITSTAAFTTSTSVPPASPDSVQPGGSLIFYACV